MKTANRYLSLIVLFFFIGIMNLGAGCSPMKQDQEKPGNVTTLSRQVSDFNAIHVGGAFEVFLTQGSSNSVLVEADKDLIDYIVTSVSGNTLEIKMKDCPRSWKSNSGPLKIYITYKEINNMELSGAVEIETRNRMTGTELGLDVSGAVEARLDMAMQKLSMDISGASELDLSGTAGSVRIDGSGASEVKGYELSANDLAVYGSGAMEIKMTVNGTLKANLSGACDVRYKGNPRVDVNSSGACEVKHAE